MSAISTRDTDQESQRDCPVVVSVEELAFELMNLVSCFGLRRSLAGSVGH